jgi:ketosteroid isomerase-like protein
VKIAGATNLTGATVRTMNVDVIAFSQRWVRNWNAHDVEALLEDFHDDVIFTSPVAAKLLPETRGVVSGKAALRKYWTAAIERIPDLRFSVEGVYQGIDTIVITHRIQNDNLVNEVLTFKGNAIIEGHGTYRLAD